MKKVLLTILDGWGIAEKTPYNAIENAKTPNYDKLIREYPNTSLKADGEAVGLPEGQFGTSEVNHMTIGAGRVIWQDLPKINNAIKDGTFFENPALDSVISSTMKNEGDLHLVGIVSDGGVHSHLEHLFALLKLLNEKKFENQIFIHAFVDGRDVAPISAEKYLKELDKEIKKYPQLNISLATMQGRSYLDRDRDWNRTETAFKLISEGKGNHVKGWEEALNLSYPGVSTDEQIGQFCFDENAKMKSGDGMIFFHFRTDRVYQLLRRVIDEKFDNFNIATFIQVSEEFTDVKVAFPRDKIENTLAETLSHAHKKQLHITETEKYAHLTFFFNGEKEKELAGETWSLLESNRYVKPYYNIEPTMRNFDIAKGIVDSIEHDKYDFIVANFSSADMVGHTGDYNAAVVSAQAVDHCLGKIYEVIKDKLDQYAWIITADHGNSEIMWDEENNQPHTQHTLSRVPLILVSDYKDRLDARESLSDIAPTVLDLMKIKKPAQMTGESLVVKK